MRRALAIFMAVGALAAVPAASASSVTTELRCGGGFSGVPLVCGVVDRVVFRAAHGEANRVTVARRGSQTLVRDAGAELAALGDCVRIDARTARCPSGRDPLVKLGDADDTLGVLTPVDAYGGEGDDVFSGSTGDDQFSGDGGEDRMDGGEGVDLLNGGLGRDLVAGGPGDDLLSDGDGPAPQPDVFDGGEGTDALTYTGRAVALTADLAAGTGSEDTYAGIEKLAGGSGADTLTAAPAGSTLFGGDGDDTLVGGAGPDVLYGAAGTDALTGAGGDDLLSSGGVAFEGGGFDSSPDPGNPADRLACGPGSDVMYSLTATLASVDCERTILFCGLGRTLPRVMGDRVLFVVPRRCGDDDVLTLTGPGGEDYGRARVRPRGRLGGTATVRLTPAGRAALAAAGPVTVSTGLAGYTIPFAGR